METILSIINVVGVIGATIISAITLFTTKNLQTMQQKVNVMANKRSERIDSLRNFSADVITYSKLFLYEINGPENKKDLISAADNFIALLQYEYKHDIELIDCANDVVRLCLEDKIDKDRLRERIGQFWTMCDVYVGVEYERLKIESKGLFNGSGEIKSESDTFEQIYQKLRKEQDGAVSVKKE